MAEFHAELDPDVGVETTTFLAFEDSRPTEVVMAGTSDDSVLHRQLNPVGMALLSLFLMQLAEHGMEPV